MFQAKQGLGQCVSGESRLSGRQTHQCLEEARDLQSAYTLVHENRKPWKALEQVSADVRDVSQEGGGWVEPGGERGHSGQGRAWERRVRLIVSNTSLEEGRLSGPWPQRGARLVVSLCWTRGLRRSCFLAAGGLTQKHGVAVERTLLTLTMGK